MTPDQLKTLKRLLDEANEVPLLERIAIQLHAAGVTEGDVAEARGVLTKHIPDVMLLRLANILIDLNRPGAFTKKQIKIAMKTKL